MGDIADMVLEGLLDCETGEYIGDHNTLNYGSESPGFPVTLNKDDSVNEKRFACDVCGKKFRSLAGMYHHKQDAHRLDDKSITDLSDRVKRLLCSPFNKKHELIYEWIKNGVITKREYFDFIGYERGNKL